MMVLIIGVNGQLGSDLKKVLPQDSVIPLTHSDIEITDFTQSREFISRHKPDFVINTAAYHRVDECEKNFEKSFSVNTNAVRNLALICREIDAVFVHFSTDYVFSGEKGKPYLEDDLPCPLNIYGVSKLAGEYFIKSTLKKYLIIRTSGLFGVAGSSGKGGNFVENMLKAASEKRELNVVSDQVLTPTYTKDLARKIIELIERCKYGLYHITNNGECSWFEFAKAIFEFSGVNANLKETTSEKFGAIAKRPKYSVLENGRLKSLGMDDMRDWRIALKDYLISRK